MTSLSSVHPLTHSQRHRYRASRTLKAITRLCLFADNIQDRVNQLSTLCVVTLGPVVSSTSLHSQRNLQVTSPIARLHSCLHGLSSRSLVACNEVLLFLRAAGQEPGIPVQRQSCQGERSGHMGLSGQSPWFQAPATVRLAQFLTAPGELGAGLATWSARARSPGPSGWLVARNGLQPAAAHHESVG